VPCSYEHNACWSNATAVLFVNEELRRFWPKVSAVTREHPKIAMTRAFFDEGEVTKAIDRILVVAGFWGLLGQFARLHAFGEWRGKAVDAAPQLEALVWNMLKPCRLGRRRHRAGRWVEGRRRGAVGRPGRRAAAARRRYVLCAL
jgi:hypothetical protein